MLYPRFYIFSMRQYVILFIRTQSNQDKKERGNMMSIYKKEVTMEEMQQESIQRMELLHLDRKITQDFAQNGSIFLSQQFGDQIGRASCRERV